MSSTGQIEAVRLQVIVEARRLTAARSAAGGPYEIHGHGWRVFDPAAESQTGGRGHGSRYEARAAGLCGCGRPRVPGRSQCAVCRTADRERSKARVQRDIAAGVCVLSGCMAPAAPGRRSCEKHLAAARERERRRHGRNRRD